MERYRWAVFLLLVLASPVFADVCIYKFRDDRSFQILYDFLSENLDSSEYNVRLVSKTDFSGCKVLIIDQEMRNKPTALFNLTRVSNEILRTRPNVILIRNAITLYPVLTKKGNVCRVWWNPFDRDRMGIVVMRNDTILRGFRIGQWIRTWQQIPGQDSYTRLCNFENGTDGEIIAGFYTCYYNICGTSTKRDVLAISDYPGGYVLAMTNFRYLPEYLPTKAAWEILKRSVIYMYENHGGAMAEISHASWNRDLIVEYSGEYCDNNSLENLVVEGEEVNFTENYMAYQGNSSGSHVFRFSVKPNSKWIGNISVKFRDICGNYGEFSVFRNLTARSRLVIITDSDIKNIFRASVLGYPLVALGFSDRDGFWKDKFIREYDTRNVLCVGVFDSSCTRLAKPDDLYIIFPRNGTVTIPPSPMGAYGAVYAVEKGKGVEFGNDETYYENFVPCLYDIYNNSNTNCSMSGGVLSMFGSHDTNKIFVFSDTNLSAYAPLLYMKGYLPAYYPYSNSSKFSDAIFNTFRYAKVPAKTRIMNTYVLVSGINKMPVKDPLGKDMIMTYVPYIDYVYVSALSEATNPYHIIYPMFLDHGDKIFIAAAYGAPKYADLLWTGMDSAFFLDLFLRSKGYDVTRHVEHRLDVVDILPFDGLYNFYNEDFFVQYFIDTVLERLGIKDIVDTGMSFKYTILETDWFSVFSGHPRKLRRLNNTEVLKKMKRSDIFFYFGPGNSTALNLPPDLPADERALITNPYPGGNEIYPDNISSWVNMIFSPYSSRGFDSPVFVGYSEKPRYAEIIQTYHLIKTISSNKPLSHLPRRIMDSIITYSIGDDILSKTADFIIAGYNRLAARQMMILEFRGLPEFTIDPEPETEEYPTIEGNSIMFRKTMDLDYEIVNDTILYQNVSSYVMDYGKPVVPQYTFKLIMPRGARYEVGAEYQKADLKPIVIGDENYTIYPDRHFYFKEINATDNTSIVYLTVIPVVYNRTGPDEYMTSFSITISSESPIKVRWKYDAGVLKINLSDEANLEVDGSFEGYGRSFSVRVDEGRHVLTIWKDELVLKFSISVEEKPDFIIMGYQKVDGPDHSYRMVRNYRQYLEYNSSSGSTRIFYRDIGFRVEINQSSKSMTKFLEDSSGRIYINETPSGVFISVTSPHGVWFRNLSGGSAREWFYGRKEVRKDAERLIESLRKNLTMIDKLVRRYILTIK